MLKSPTLNICIKVFIVFITGSIILSCNYHKLSKKTFTEEEDGPRETLERDIRMMKDPALGYVPTERLLKAKQYRDQLWQSQNNAVLPGVSWNPLGPKNQGGRTRSLLIDANDATGNTVWVGSVGGGLWKTTDITAATPNWAPTNDLFANLSIPLFSGAEIHCLWG